MVDENETIRLLLACGIGASTGFMAANMRKIAKQRGLDVTVSAVSKSEIMDYADKIDALLLGPHFAAEVPATQKQLEPYGVKIIMPPSMVRGFSRTHTIFLILSLMASRGRADVECYD